jgi:Na+-translocating ferredoxin:NAD+ oxidoreductase RnfD subunit
MADTAIDAADTDLVAPQAAAERAIHFRGNAYPVILPKLRDPRLHVAAVVITIHVLGQVGLGFQVSVPQILAAILTAAILGVAITFRSTRSFVWPASAMLTGSGIALILRVPDTPLHDHWTLHKWYVFAGVAAFAIVIKQLVQYRGNPLFNPSNVALVTAFLLLGSARVAPLDFWWAPLNGWMIAAYAVILIGGTLITRRMRLLVLAATFWVAFSIGLGLVAASGHCMTANWAFAPVCGADFWRVVVTSPELLIFMFFMITDPKTVPTGRVGRVVFALLVAATCILLIAPQTTEFGTKVALLGGLTLMCACRPLLDRVLPVPGADDDRLRLFAARLTTGSSTTGTLGRVARVGVIAVVVLAAGTGVVLAGRSASGAFAAEGADVLGRVPHAVNPATFPTITVEQGVLDWNHAIAGSGAQAVVLTLAENLEIESQALLRADPTILVAVDHGDRLDAMRARLQDAAASGTMVVRSYRIDTVNVTLLVPFGRQDGLSLGLQSRGTLTEKTYDTAGHLQSSVDSPFATTFVVRRATGARWLNVAELPLANGN